MRTANDIENNINNIAAAKRTLMQQIELLEAYQQNAVKNIGHRLADWDEMQAKFLAAKEALNAMWHMELDAQDEANNQ